MVFHAATSGRRINRQQTSAASVPAEPLPEPPEPTSSPVPEPAPADKPVHPWKRAWSIHRQRELANSA